ncbi:SPEF1 protein, partial [Asarcornis scutulata]|nr:SPEF1 protein [Asarcornis scutulata]
MVQLHSYVPASSTPQKLANWGHLNRKVLSKLNFSLPDEVIRQVAQCRPGAVEQVLLLLRQKIEEKQKQSKALPGPHQVLGTAGGLSPAGCGCCRGAQSLSWVLPSLSQGEQEPGSHGGRRCRPPAAGREGAGAAPGP